MKNVSIYSTPSCHFCHMVKDFFKENNIAFTDHNVAANMERRKEMLDKSGQMGVPVILIDEEMIIGFNKPKVVKALGL